MIRLYLTVEGETEVAFARQVLAPCLQTASDNQIMLLAAGLMSHGKRHGVIHRGGAVRYEPMRNDIIRNLKRDRSPEARFSTMIDLYRLPHGFPSYADAKRMSDPYKCVEMLEAAFERDIGDPRFMAYIQLHEFEALLLAEPDKFRKYYPDYEHGIARLSKLCVDFGDKPEGTNDGENTAPSKRIGREIPRYLEEKTTAGPAIAKLITLPVIRSKCSHFNSWLTRLEGLAAEIRN